MHRIPMKNLVGLFLSFAFAAFNRTTREVMHLLIFWLLDARHMKQSRPSF